MGLFGKKKKKKSSEGYGISDMSLRMSLGSLLPRLQRICPVSTGSGLSAAIRKDVFLPLNMPTTVHMRMSLRMPSEDFRTMSSTARWCARI